MLRSGAIASAASAAAALACSHAENGHAARPINAVAHIYDGGEPEHGDGERGRNTWLGLAIHTAASIGWAAFFEAAPGRPLARSAAVSAVAYVVDYYVVPRRFRPGFEAALGPRSMFAVYAALAAGFFLSAASRRERQRYRA